MPKQKSKQIKEKNYAVRMVFLGLLMLATTIIFSIAAPYMLNPLSDWVGITYLHDVLTPNDLLPVIGVIAGLCVTCWTYLETKDRERVERETLLESLVPSVQIIEGLETEDWSWRFTVRNLGSQPLKNVTLASTTLSRKLEEGSACSFRYLSNGSVQIEDSNQTIIPSHRLDFIVEPKDARDQWDVERLDFSIQCYDIKERHWVLSFAYTEGKIIETKRPYQV